MIYKEIPGKFRTLWYGANFLAPNWMLFFLYSVLLSIYAVIFYLKGHWELTRLFALNLVLILCLLVFTIRPIFMMFSFGQESVLLENKENSGLYVDLKLYEDGVLFSKIYD